MNVMETVPAFGYGWFTPFRIDFAAGSKRGFRSDGGDILHDTASPAWVDTRSSLRVVKPGPCEPPWASDLACVI
jgi:hypothetical protein